MKRRNRKANLMLRLRAPRVSADSVAGALAFLLVLAVPGALAAQLASAPVFQSLKHDPTWSIHLDYGNGARAVDGLSLLGARISYTPNSEAEQGMLRLSLMGGLLSPEQGDASLALGASAGLALRPRRLMQFEPQLGLGWTDAAGSAQFDVPLSFAVGINASLPPLWFTALISRNPQFWLAPRVQLRTTDIGDEGTQLRAGFGLAYGMEFRAQNGLGVQFVWERMAMRDAFRPRWKTEGALGLSFFFAWI
jgi:hypothetical protein